MTASHSTRATNAIGADGRLLVVGAGTMGAQIAQQAALHGIDVALVDVNPEVLRRAMTSNRQWLDRRVDKGKLEAAAADAAAHNVNPTSDLAAAASGSAWAIEAVVEVPSVKREVFAALDTHLPPGPMLAGVGQQGVSGEDAQVRRDRALMQRVMMDDTQGRLVPHGPAQGASARSPTTTR